MIASPSSFRQYVDETGSVRRAAWRGTYRRAIARPVEPRNFHGARMYTSPCRNARRRLGGPTAHTSTLQLRAHVLAVCQDNGLASLVWLGVNTLDSRKSAGRRNQPTAFLSCIWRIRAACPRSASSWLVRDRDEHPASAVSAHDGKPRALEQDDVVNFYAGTVCREGADRFIGAEGVDCFGLFTSQVRNDAITADLRRRFVGVCHGLNI